MKKPEATLPVFLLKLRHPGRIFKNACCILLMPPKKTLRLIHGGFPKKHAITGSILDQQRPGRYTAFHMNCL
jgi:hypothetical protein